MSERLSAAAEFAAAFNAERDMQRAGCVHDEPGYCGKCGWASYLLAACAALDAERAAHAETRRQLAEAHAMLRAKRKDVR